MWFLLCLVVDFFATVFGLWLILLVLNVFGIDIIFTWGLAVGFWIIVKIVKIILL